MREEVFGGGDCWGGNRVEVVGGKTPSGRAKKAACQVSRGTEGKRRKGGVKFLGRNFKGGHYSARGGEWVKAPEKGWSDGGMKGGERGGECRGSGEKKRAHKNKTHQRGKSAPFIRDGWQERFLGLNGRKKKK